MNAHKLQVKIFAEAGTHVALEAFIPVLHGWIKNHVLPELMIDVANYAHVPKGPGVVLIGHASDYFMDEADGRLGLLYNRKRAPPEPSQRMGDAFRRALHAAALLEKEPLLEGKLRFAPGELLVRLNDRLLAPNDDATFDAVRPELEQLGGILFAGPFELARAGTPRGPFAVTLSSPAKLDLATMLGRLGGPPTP